MKTLRNSSTLLSVALLLSTTGLFADGDGFWQKTKDFSKKYIADPAVKYVYNPVLKPYATLEEDELNERITSRVNKIDTFENLRVINDKETNEESLTFKERAKLMASRGVAAYTRKTSAHPNIANGFYYPLLTAAVGTLAYGTYKAAKWAKNKFWNKNKEQDEQEVTNEAPKSKIVTGLSKEDAKRVKSFAKSIYNGKKEGQLIDALIESEIGKKVASDEDFIILVNNFDEAMHGVKGLTSDELKQYRAGTYNMLNNFLNAFIS